MEITSMSNILKKTKVCRVCGKPFYITSTAQNGRKYCSEECRKEEAAKKSRRWRSDHKKIFEPYTKTCMWCGKKFLIESPSASRRRYCSDKCRQNKKAKEQKEERKTFGGSIVKGRPCFFKVPIDIEEARRIGLSLSKSYGDVTKDYYAPTNVKAPYGFGTNKKVNSNIIFRWKKSEGRRK